MMYYLQAALSFPTIIFSFLLCFCTILWLMTAMGLVGFEAGDIDLDTGDIGGDAGDGVSAAEAVGFLSRFGLNGVPITLVISLLSAFGWIISFLSQVLFLNHITVALIYYPLAITVLIVSIFISVYLTAKVCRPLRISFRSQEAVSKRHLIGQVATVRSSTVDMKYGEAVMNDGGAGLILRVRDDQNQGFTQGDKVILLEFLEDTQTYRVVSEDEFKGI